MRERRRQVERRGEQYSRIGFVDHRVRQNKEKRGLYNRRKKGRGIEHQKSEDEEPPGRRG